MFLMHFLISPFYYLQKAKYEINIKYIIVNIVPFIISFVFDLSGTPTIIATSTPPTRPPI